MHTNLSKINPVHLAQISDTIQILIDNPTILHALKQIIQEQCQTPHPAPSNNHQVMLLNKKLCTIVLQALINIHNSQHVNALGQDERDFSMQGIGNAATELVKKSDPNAKVHSRLASRVLTEGLGLAERSQQPKTRRDVLIYTSEELEALANRFGLKMESDPIAK